MNKSIKINEEVFDLEIVKASLKRGDVKVRFIYKGITYVYKYIAGNMYSCAFIMVEETEDVVYDSSKSINTSGMLHEAIRQTSVDMKKEGIDVYNRDNATTSG